MTESTMNLDLFASWPEHSLCKTLDTIQPEAAGLLLTTKKGDGFFWALFASTSLKKSSDDVTEF